MGNVCRVSKPKGTKTPFWSLQVIAATCRWYQSTCKVRLPVNVFSDLVWVEPLSSYKLSELANKNKNSNNATKYPRSHSG